MLSAALVICNTPDVIYAHQSYKPDKTHIKDSNKRDDDEFVPLRYDTAKAVASSIINSWHNTHTFNAM